MNPETNFNHEALKGLRVLVVEDLMVVAEEIAGMLQRLNCVVVGPAARLPSAFEIIDHEPVDIAILDVNLSGEAVFPFAEELRRRRIPFVLATGYADAGILADYQNCPRLEKPFGVTELIETLGSAISSGSLD